MESISLQCPVTIKVKVTEKFRAKMLDKMEKQLAEVDLKLSKIDIQKKKFLEEHAEDNIQQVGAIVQKKPMFSISSASSSTTWVTWARSMLWCL